jgi:predicted 2-oxoglutarate/Fe(II)-dependent dioxygenase YbiX
LEGDNEMGVDNPSIPTWANETQNPLKLLENTKITPNRVDIKDIPAAFQILNVLSPKECDQLISLSESLGYLEDAAVSLPRSVRHNENIVWVTDNSTEEIIWNRIKPFMNQNKPLYNGQTAVGLNQRFRFYKYQKGDFFKSHTDGAWPGSRVIEKQLIQNAFSNRYSQMTFLLFLSDGYKGGETQFWVDKDNRDRPAYEESKSIKVDIKTPKGGVLCFPHGFHPLHCLHSSEPVLSGVKVIIRSDVLFASPCW